MDEKDRRKEGKESTNKIPPEQGWLCCVTSKDRKAKCRTIKTKTQVRMK